MEWIEILPQDAWGYVAGTKLVFSSTVAPVDGDLVVVELNGMECLMRWRKGDLVKVLGVAVEKMIGNRDERSAKEKPR